MAATGRTAVGNNKPRASWWSTLPGILTGIAATITAIGGLIIAVGNAGWFSGGKSAAPVSSASLASAPAASAPDVVHVTEAAPVAAASTSATVPAGAGSHAVVLPEQRDYTFGDGVFTLLAATLAPRNSESKTLTIRVRMLNNNLNPRNFWDSEFRLLVDGVPRSPESGLDEVVAGRSAKDGDVKFVVPAETRAATLRIYYAEEQSDIPLGFGG